MKRALILLAVFLSGLLPLAAGLRTGETAPEFSSPAWFGKSGPFRLADYRGKKPVVLYFWSVTPASFNELPRIKAVFHSYQGKVAFFGITAEKKAKLDQFPLFSRMPFPSAADSDGAYSAKLLRQADTPPVAAVLDKEGRICWRGPVRMLGSVLKDVTAGKFDLAERIRREKFSDSIHAAMAKKDYARTLEILEPELKNHPGNWELVSLKVQLLHQQKQDRKALEALEAAKKARPRYLPFYELELQLTGFRDLEKRGAFYRRFAADFRDRPMTLLRFAEKEMSLPPERLHPEFSVLLGRSAWEAPRFRDNREKGIIGLEYAKILHSCSRVDLARTMAQRALPLLKGTPEERAAQAAVAYYERLLQLAPTLGVPAK